MLDDDIFYNIVEFRWSSVGSGKCMSEINEIVKRNVSDEFFLQQFLLNESPKSIILDVHSSKISTDFTERFIAFPIEVLDVLFQNRRDDIVEMAVNCDFVVP